VCHSLFPSLAWVSFALLLFFTPRNCTTAVLSISYGGHRPHHTIHTIIETAHKPSRSKKILFPTSSKILIDFNFSSCLRSLVTDTPVPASLAANSAGNKSASGRGHGLPPV
jgi:hypothetical protein